MPGNVIGGQKAAATNKRKYGQGFYNRIGKLGGAAGRGHAFAHGKLDPGETGRIGGGHPKPAWTPERKARHSQLMKQKAKKAAPKEAYVGSAWLVTDPDIDANIIEPFNKQPWHKGWIKRSK